MCVMGVVFCLICDACSLRCVLSGIIFVTSCMCCVGVCVMRARVCKR